MNYLFSHFLNLAGRTLDTSEGKPGSLRQTAEEVLELLMFINLLLGIAVGI